MIIIFHICNIEIDPRKSQVYTSNFNYLTSTVAPAASSLAFNSSASALETFSLTGFGAPSTKSLDSFKPKPVTSLTTLITPNLAAPAFVKITSNSVCSAAAAGAAPAAGAAATAVGSIRILPS